MEWEWECDDLGIPNVCAVFGTCTVWVRDMAQLDGRLRGFVGRWQVVVEPTDNCNRLQWRFFELGDALRFAPRAVDAVSTLQSFVDSWEEAA